ncbi:hypothetical protein G9X52_10975 [Cronobacter sakazakii]|uniref:hypothetical protein n=1 Tax=Cronobacter sakazakii TaxID=28141 RepID=UPI000A19295D|nr:hypothetical protein [Cronobacter sakazakii]EGT4310364.1 hypothetical protein [Cronobacter sakazakii]EIZ9495398.1 hypothetical protein [Cronobacter sakazakii]ELY4225184.1 hypothetical protein [Cronobacter sakazakii]ELY4259975.1 hypothetical protein [Cronobacter sakazakii]ELY4668848.1 hypothetical protein [Cronobacter sakazakii]
MGKENRLTLKLDGTSPSELSMARLGKYLSALSDLYGSVDAVHFKDVSEGSACLNTWVDNENSYNAVIQRSISQAATSGSSYLKLVSLLAQDGFEAKIINHDKVTILEFPSASEQAPLVIRKKGRVQGKLYNVGGKDESAPVKLEGANGETYHCEATPALAAKLGALLFKQLRVSGDSEWIKKDDKWKLKKLIIESYEVLEKSNLKTAFKALQNASGNQWKEEDDAQAILKALRALNCE